MEAPLPRSFERALRRLVLAFAPERIVLFGSRAKGTNHAGSDVDLLVVADLQGNPSVYRRRAQRIVAACFPPVDVVFCSAQDARDAPTARSPFLQSILQTGTTIYARTPLG
jgi:predicted nucleotidyltransferase